MGERIIIELEQGWDFMQKGITKLKNNLEEGIPAQQQFTSDEYIQLYVTVYNMCTQKPPHDYSQQLYDKYRETFEEYNTSMVLPALREKHDEFMLSELVKRWGNHKTMVRWLSRFFNYLDRYFIARHSLPALYEVGLMCFRDLVYQEIRNNVKDAVIALIDRERNREQIDRALLKNVLGIFVDIGMGNMDYYENDFELYMLEDTASYYSQKAASWILEDSCPDYMLKAEECLIREKERVADYLHSSSEQKVLEKVQNELLSQYESKLLEKENSGCHALLSNDKVDDLSRMYRLFCRIPKGLEPVAQIFKQHVTDEVTSLVKQAEDAASNKKAEKDDTVGGQDLAFMMKVIELHDKYLQYVNECFMHHSLFNKPLKEAFEVFCDKGVAGNTSAELLARFCNILKKCGSEKLSDEDIKDTLEKVMKLIGDISDKDLFAEFYRNTLARRLMFDKSANDDHERSILTKLNRQCGGQFTSKMEGMVLSALKEKHHELIMLRELVKRWGNHKIMVRWLSCFFNYLDRYFIARRSLPDLNEVGLMCFQDLVYKEIRNNVKDAVIALIDREREGEQIDRALLKNVLGIFVEIGMGNMDYYENDFELYMLEDTASYYSRKVKSWSLEDSCPDYMLKAEECLKREKERVAHYLHSSSEQKLLEKVQNELVSQCVGQVLEKEHSGCHALVDDLSRMYRLFCRIPKGLEPVAQIFKQHVTDEVTSLVKQAEDAASKKKAEKDTVGAQEQTFVRKVIELHDKYLQYVNECFMNHSLFRKALKEAFEVFCNKGVAGSTNAELLATVCDNILKKGGNEELSDEDIEDSLEKVVKLLAYTSDKYLFAEFYRKKLVRRLLFDKSANEDHERSVLTKLKQEYGCQFTSKMEGMVNDITLTRENQSSFEEYLNEHPNMHPGIDISVTVLTTGFWPSFKSSYLNLPAEMVRCVEVFKEFYQTKTKKRKLTWIYSLGSCNINGRFEPKQMELIVTTNQASALLLFNASERLSYSEIKSQLNLTDKDIVRLLHSLACAKHKILNKEPNTKTVAQTDYFEFNAKFTDKMRRIKIPLLPVDEKKKVIEDVDKDRHYAIDASIVRIMKSQKVLAHQQLVMECVEQLGRMFKPDFKAIKKRIEDLITREYLERDKDNPNVYRYLA